MKRVGFVGWRGMVGSVLMNRMSVENDFADIEPVFFTTSQVGQAGPAIGKDVPTLKDAKDISELKTLDVIVTCQGSAYTNEIYPVLRKEGWDGYWIDAASSLRMSDESVIVLDPVNKDVIESNLAKGGRAFIGGNCTVSLMLMAMGGLFAKDLVEWITPMTYQAASGAGAKNMRELIRQMGAIHDNVKNLLDDPATTILDIDKNVTNFMRSETYPTECWPAPLAASLIPWIDVPLESGQSKEEWKAQVETNKILGRADNPIPIDGLCVRIGSMRCHSQALTIKLKQDVPLDEISDMLASHNEWVQVLPNEPDVTIKQLSPAAVSGTLSVPVGRMRKLTLGNDYLSAFTVGDQLLWGAAEPLRRMLKLLA